MGTENIEEAGIFRLFYRECEVGSEEEIDPIDEDKVSENIEKHLEDCSRKRAAGSPTEAKRE